MVPPVQVIAAFKFTQTPLTLRCPILQTGFTVVPPPVPATQRKLAPPPWSAVPPGQLQAPLIMVPPAQAMATHPSAGPRTDPGPQDGNLTGNGRTQFGGVPTKGGMHAVAVTQFGGVPV